MLDVRRLRPSLIVHVLEIVNPLKPVLIIGLLTASAFVPFAGIGAQSPADATNATPFAPHTIVHGAVYTSVEVAGDRSLDTYRMCGPVTSRQILGGGDCSTVDRIPARTFVLECWQRKQRGYLVINSESWRTYSSDPPRRLWPVTVHVFIEPSSTGKWRILWREVDHLGRITEDYVFDRLATSTEKDEVCNGEVVQRYKRLRFSARRVPTRWL